jgi:hypothetical protein
MQLHEVTGKGLSCMFARVACKNTLLLPPHYLFEGRQAWEMTKFVYGRISTLYLHEQSDAWFEDCFDNGHNYPLAQIALS